MDKALTDLIRISNLTGKDSALVQGPGRHTSELAVLTTLYFPPVLSSTRKPIGSIFITVPPIVPLLSQ